MTVLSAGSSSLSEVSVLGTVSPGEQGGEIMHMLLVSPGGLALYTSQRVATQSPKRTYEAHLPSSPFSTLPNSEDMMYPTQILCAMGGWRNGVAEVGGFCLKD